MEGIDVAIAVLLEKLSICEFYAGIYIGVPLPSQTTPSHPELQGRLDSALPKLYAAIIVFAVKTHSYFKASGMWGT